MLFEEYLLYLVIEKTKMKKFILIASLLLNMVLLAQEIKTGQVIPSFTIKSEEGMIRSSDLKGKVVLINFFATWCKPCMLELPHLQTEIWEKYKNDKRFSLLIIGREHSQSEIAEFKAKKGFQLPIYPDEDRSAYSLFAKEYIPRNYIMDKDGKVVFSSVGFNEAEFKEMIKKVDELLR